MPALSNVAITDTFDTWRIRTNQLIVKSNGDETYTAAAYDKANAANLLAYNTGIGTNTYLLNTIAGANAAVGTGANTYLLATLAGANVDIGIGANTYSLATITGANNAVGSGANAYATSAAAGANAYMISVQNGSNTAVGTGANAFTSATIAGANTAVGTGANAFTSATIAGANNISIAAFNKANTALPNTSGTTFAGNLNITGNVGIGTTSPTTKLNVFGSASGGITTLTDNTSIVLDMTSNNNFKITLGGSNTFINPTVMNPGQSGVIEIIQDTNGSYAPSWGSYWKFPSNIAPTLTTTANSKDVVVYYVSSTTSIVCQLILNIG
jgi:hypothetical protein